MKSSHAPSKNRLKPVKHDPLDTIGLPSKGETGLTSYKAQEDYFDSLQQRAQAFGLSVQAATRDLKADQSNGHDLTVLERGLNDLSLEQAWKSTSSESSHELVTILSAMRKLRESVIATQRFDNFSRLVYLFIIRTTIPISHHEAYHPALLHALRVLDRRCPFASEEQQELASYAVCDLAGRQDAMREAWEAAWKYRLFSPAESSRTRDRQPTPASQRSHARHVHATLQSALHLDIPSYHSHKRHLSTNEQVLLRPLDDRLTARAIAALSRAYLTADISYVEQLLNLRWSNEQEKQERGVAHATSSWATEGGKLVFRRPRVR